MSGAKEVHLGFLKIAHTYEITFELLHDLGRDIKFNVLENLCAKIKSVTPCENGHTLVVEFNAQKERIVKEKLTLTNPAGTKLTMILLARVLGKKTKVPLL